MKLTGENRQLGEKPVPVPLCPPQTPHALTRDRTRASAVKSRRLTAWAMARPWRWVVFFCVMEPRWNETDTGKPKSSGKNLSQCHFVHHKSHIDWPAMGGRRLTAWATARPTISSLSQNLTYYHESLPQGHIDNSFTEIHFNTNLQSMRQFATSLPSKTFQSNTLSIPLSYCTSLPSHPP
jgi:hypothetical protein